MPTPWIETFAETNGTGPAAGELVDALAAANLADNGKILFLLEKDGDRTVVRAFRPHLGSLPNCHVGYNRSVSPLRIVVNFATLLGFDPKQVRVATAKLDGREYKDLAREAGLSRSVFSHYMLGERHTPDVQVRVAHVFGATREEFYPEEAA